MVAAMASTINRNIASLMEAKKVTSSVRISSQPKLGERGASFSAATCCLPFIGQIALVRYETRGGSDVLRQKDVLNWSDCVLDTEARQPFQKTSHLTSGFEEESSKHTYADPPHSSGG